MTRRALATVLLSWLVLAGFAPPLAAQAAAGDLPAGGPVAIEVIDEGDSEPVGSGPQGLGDFLGRLHHAVVHLPIGWLVFVVMLDITGFGFRRRAAQELGLWALGLTLLAFVPAIVTGLLRAGHVSEGPEIQALVGQHQAMIFITFGLAVLAFGVRWMNRDHLDGVVRGTYLTLVCLAAGLMGVAGHWGGRIVFGPDFLGF